MASLVVSTRHLCGVRPSPARRFEPIEDEFGPNMRDLAFNPAAYNRLFAPGFLNDPQDDAINLGGDRTLRDQIPLQEYRQAPEFPGVTCTANAGDMMWYFRDAAYFRDVCHHALIRDHVPIDVKATIDIVWSAPWYRVIDHGEAEFSEEMAASLGGRPYQTIQIQNYDLKRPIAHTWPAPRDIPDADKVIPHLKEADSVFLAMEHR
ncbi:hypothetical protein PG984_007202 [Apiospora sp. TS-2023a]